MSQAPAARGRGSRRVVLSGGDVVLPDRILSPAAVVLSDGRIEAILPGRRVLDTAAGDIDCAGRYILPGFVDVHVHGVEGLDALDGPDAIARIAAVLPRYGVAAFCPTSVACAPPELRTMLAAVRAAHASSTGSRVLPAHLESNFINPDYRGAQPLQCIRSAAGSAGEGGFSGRDILDEIHAAPGDVGIMTIAPELDGALELIRSLTSQGIAVSLGHSGASYEQGRAGIEAGARQATHLFNRMTPLGHRAPGLAGAALADDRVTVEIIPDSVHVHPTMVRLALAIKRPHRVMAITDGTGGSGLPRGARAALGGRQITVGDAAYLDDGTIAGSVLTMDQAFAAMTQAMGLTLVDAAHTCATTPARALGLEGYGAIAEGNAGDLVILDQALHVVATYIGGEMAWPRVH